MRRRAKRLGFRHSDGVVYRALLMSALTTSIALAACGSESTSTSDPPAPGELAGVYRVFTPWDAQFAEPVRLFVGEHELRWEAGCNEFVADFHPSEHRLIVGSIAGTDVGCPVNVATAERRLASFLGSDPLLVIAETGIQLKATNLQLELRRWGHPEQ